MATLEARSVVGLAEMGRMEEEDGEEDPMLDALGIREKKGNKTDSMLDAVDDEKILRITAIHNSFDASYDDGKSGGYRHLSVSVEVMILFLSLSAFVVSLLSLSFCVSL